MCLSLPISNQERSVLEVPLPAETTSAHHLQHVDQVVPAQLNPLRHSIQFLT